MTSNDNEGFGARVDNDDGVKGIKDISDNTASMDQKEEARTIDTFEFPLKFGKIKGISQAKNRAIEDDSISNDSIAIALQNMIQLSKAPKMGRGLAMSSNSANVSRSEWENLDWKRKNEDEDELGNTAIPEFFIPKSKSVSVEAHERSVTALALNPKGSRLATGGYDAEVRLWDFNGMVTHRDSFRRFTPIAGHGIKGLSYSPTGSHFVCASGDAIARVYDVDGKQIQATVKGDMYVRDLSNTKGHTHGLMDCEWHPFDKEKFLTASQDATVRIFDINSKPYGIDEAIPHLHILKAVDKRNLNIAGQCHVKCARWGPCSAKYIVGGCSDGSLQLWNEKKVYSKPDKIVRDAHLGDITGLSIFQDDLRIVTRGRDSAMKLWDIRKLKDPVHIWNDLDNDVSELSVCISPDQSMIATSSESLSGNPSFIHIFNSTTFELIDSIPVKSEARKAEGVARERTFVATRILWPESLNQLILGCTDGTVRLLYDPQYSSKGALLFADRQVLKSRHNDNLLTFNQPIFSMDSLPKGMRQTREGGIRRVRLREQDKTSERQPKTIVPPKPSGKEGVGGQRATHGSLSSHIMGKINISSTRDEDPVEALRAYAARAEAEPVFVSRAYEETQPKQVLDFTPEEGDDQLLVQNKSKCPRCGLKMCQCGYMRLQESIRGPLPKQRRIE